MSYSIFLTDGSEAVFYLSRNPDSKHWVVQLQAGGSCGTYDSCLDRSRSLLGSSRNYSDFMTGTFVASDDPGENPMFSSWNKVFVPYCRYVPTCKGINPLTIGFITSNNSGYSCYCGQL